MIIFAERQNRKLIEQLEEQKKRLRMQNQQQTAAAATTGSVFVHLYIVNYILRYCYNTEFNTSATSSSNFDLMPMLLVGMWPIKSSAAAIPWRSCL